MRKIIAAQVKPEEFKTVGTWVESELEILVLLGDVSREKGDRFIIGRKAVDRFCKHLEWAIAEVEEVFTDDESKANIASDRAILKRIKNTKAS